MLRNMYLLVKEVVEEDVFTSTIDTKCALYPAVTLFNDGYTESLKNICEPCWN